MKKHSVILFFLVLLLAGITSVAASMNAVDENELQTKHCDVVFVIDDSGSMKQTDPNKLSVMAIKSIIDQLSVGDQVGLVTYGLDVEESMSLRDIRSDSDVTELKSFVDNKIYRNSDWTDTASGLIKATEYLDEFKNSRHNQAIILLTDGENDFGNTGRTAEESNANLQAAIAKGYKVYAIGLNPKSDEFKTYIENIASQTGGKAYFPANSDELNLIYDDIQKELFGGEEANTILIPTDGEAVRTIHIDEQALEANIKITHESDLTIRLTSPSGDVSVEGEDYKVISESGYTIIKMIQPESGDWELGIKGSFEEEGIISWMVRYSNIGLKLQASLIEGNEADIWLSLFYKEDDGSLTEQIENLNDYKNLTARVQYKLVGSDNYEEVLLEINKDNNQYFKRFELATGSYEFKAVVDIDGFIVETEWSEMIEIVDEVSKTTETAEASGDETDKKSISVKSWMVPIIIMLILVVLLLFIMWKKITSTVPREPEYFDVTIEMDGRAVPIKAEDIAKSNISAYQFLDRILNMMGSDAKDAKEELQKIKKELNSVKIVYRIIDKKRNKGRYCCVINKREKSLDKEVKVFERITNESKISEITIISKKMQC